MSDLVVREATAADVPGIRAVFEATYSKDYPYSGFFDDEWLTRSVYGDSLVMLVAVEAGEILGTASVVFDVGAHSDLIGEFGRLAVHPDARGRGIGRMLMEGRLAWCRERLHVGIVENRVVHPFSQRISARHGFVCVGFLPMKHLFINRESVALYAHHFGNGLTMRRNHPRLIPEAHELAHAALTACGLSDDLIVEDASGYPPGLELEFELLKQEGLPTLLRIERGRLRRREVFGPIRLQHGFFKLEAKKASYLIGRVAGSSAVAGAIGYTHDSLENGIRIFELISRSDEVVRPLLVELLERAQRRKVDVLEVDVSAGAPRLQRTLLELGFLPTAYVPAAAFHEVERLDVLKMMKLNVPLELGPIELHATASAIAEIVLEPFRTRDVLPRIADSMHQLPMLRGLDEEQVRRIACACRVREVEDGEPVFEQGSAPEAIYLVLGGAVCIEVDGAKVGQVGTHEALGEVSLLTGETHSATARACGEVELAVLDTQTVQRLERCRPDVLLQVYRNLAGGLGRKLVRADREVRDASLV